MMKKLCLAVLVTLIAVGCQKTTEGLRVDLDAAGIDGSTPDSAGIDAAGQDAGVTDAAAPDASSADASFPDAGAPDGHVDASVPDAEPGCNSVADCVDGNECTADECDADTGQCSNPPVVSGTPLLTQTAGDCERLECDGNGAVVAVADNLDVADDGNDCTVEACDQGVPTTAPVERGLLCIAGVCDGAGSCVGCNEPIDCGVDTACRSFGCDNGSCVPIEALDGVVLPEQQQVEGDCQRLVCDGNGSSRPEADDADAPEDEGNACTLESCAEGLPDVGLEQEGADCDYEGGAVCTADGACTECLGPSDCAPRVCAVAGCTGDSCAYAPRMSTRADQQHQSVGDCVDVWCDDSGTPTLVIDDADVPPDPTPNDCRANICEQGVPTPDVALEVGMPCSEGYCDQNAECKECVEDNNCQHDSAHGMCAAGSCVVAACYEPYFDVDGVVANGCEVRDGTPGANPRSIGTFGCSDSSSTFSTSGYVPSDLIFNSFSGAEPDVWTISATGGWSCLNDLDITLVVNGWAENSCYQLTVEAPRNATMACIASPTCTISSGSGSYDSNTTITMTVEKLCSSADATEDVSYTLSGHL